MKKAIFRGLKSFDYVLALVVIGVSIFGVLMIQTSVEHAGMPPVVAARFAGLWQQQRMHVISGSILMLIFAAVDYRLITKFYWFIFAVIMALLMATAIIGPDEATGVARWITIPLPGIGSINMQPSEFAKIFMILFLAKFLEGKRDVFNRFPWLMLVLALIIAPVGLVAGQPSMSAALVILFISLTVLFTAGL